MTDHAPWSRPHFSSKPTSVFAMRLLVCLASSGLPGAGYCTSKRAFGKSLLQRGGEEAELLAVLSGAAPHVVFDGGAAAGRRWVKDSSIDSIRRTN